MLARLDNIDKHRLLLPANGIAPFTKPTFTGVRRAEGTYSGDWIRLVDGAEVFRVVDWELEPGVTNVQVNAPLRYTLTFGDPEFGPAGSPHSIWNLRDRGAATVADMRIIADMVDRIIAMFDPAFESDDSPTWA